MPVQLSRVGYYLERRPHFGGLADPDAVGGANIEGRPPEAVIYLKLAAGRIANAGFQTSGCGYLIACCSALLEMSIGRTPAECRQLTDTQLADHLGGLPMTKQYCPALAVLALGNALGKLDSASAAREEAA